MSGTNDISPMPTQLDCPTEQSSARRHNDTTRFFSLPRELQDLIYEYAWDLDDDFIFKFRKIAIVVSGNIFSTDSRLGLPSWVLACKGILDGAIATLHSARRFTPLPSIVVCILHGGQYMEEEAKKNGLLFNSRIRNIGYHAGISVSRSGEDTPRWHDADSSGSLFSEYLEELGVCNLDLNHYYVKVLYSGYHVEEESLKSSNRLTNLFCGRCRSVGFTIYLPSWKDTREDLTYVRRAESIIVGARAYASKMIQGGSDMNKECTLVGDGYLKDGYIVARFQRKDEMKLTR